MTDPTTYRKQLDRLLHDYEHSTRRVQEEHICLQEARELAEACLTAQNYVQTVAEAVQQSCHQQIATLVTRCLKAVFGSESYEFRIKFSKKRGKTEAELVFIKDGMEIDPLEAAGGGVLDVSSFALRLACLILSRPHKRRILFLDESFKFLSKDYRPAIVILLKELSKELDMKFLMVSHLPEFMNLGKVIEL